MTTEYAPLPLTSDLPDDPDPDADGNLLNLGVSVVADSAVDAGDAQAADDALEESADIDGTDMPLKELVSLSLHVEQSAAAESTIEPTTVMAAPRETDQSRGGVFEFRSDVEGLRGLAVVLVLLFHAEAPFLPGGFVGVDVFYVISGYVISLVRRSDATDHLIKVAISRMRYSRDAGCLDV
jgi:hypothetical protein